MAFDNPASEPEANTRFLEAALADARNRKNAEEPMEG